MILRSAWLLVTTLAMGLASPQQLSQSFGGQTFGKQLKSVTQWNSLDFVFKSPQERQEALTAGRFIPENCIPLDMDVDYNSSELGYWGPGAGRSNEELLFDFQMPFDRVCSSRYRDLSRAFRQRWASFRPSRAQRDR